MLEDQSIKCLRSTRERGGVRCWPRSTPALKGAASLSTAPLNPRPAISLQSQATRLNRSPVWLRKADLSPARAVWNVGYLTFALVFERFAASAAARLYNRSTGPDLRVLGNEGRRLVLQHLFVLGCLLSY